MQKQKVVLFCRVDKALKEQAETLAKSEGRSLTKQVEQLLKMYCENEKKISAIQ